MQPYVRRLANPLACFFIFLYAAYIFYPVLASRELALSADGDGPPVIGLMTSFYDDVNQSGSVSWFFNDYYRPTQLLGQNADVMSPVTGIWKALWYLGNAISSPLNSLDALTFGLYLLTLWCVYWASQWLSPSLTLRIAAVILFARSPVIIRLNSGHLDLGLVLCPLIIVLGIYRLSFANWGYRNGIIAGLAMSLCFSFGPYYAYYGLIYASVYLLTYALTSKAPLKRWLDLVRMGTAFGGFFLIGMCLWFPTVVFKEKIWSMFSGGASQTVAPNRHHDWRWFVEFSAGKVDYLGLFRGNSVNGSILGIPDNFLIAYRFGFFALGACILLGVLLALGKHRTYVKTWLAPATVAFAVAIFVAGLLALNATSPYSLVPLTYKFAPMFRCSDRAMVYIHCGVLVFFLVLAAHLLKARQDWLARFLVLFLTVLIAHDITATTLWTQLPARALSIPSDFVEIRNRPEENFGELPMDIAPSYMGTFYYALHRKTVLFEGNKNRVGGNALYAFPKDQPKLQPSNCELIKTGAIYAFCRRTIL